MVIEQIKEEFLKKYKQYLALLRDSFISQQLNSGLSHKLAQLVLNRFIIFKFLESARILGQSEFVSNLIRIYRSSRKYDNFYREFFLPFCNHFTSAANTPRSTLGTEIIPEKTVQFLKSIPDLKIWLFKGKSYETESHLIPDSLVFDIFENFLEEFTFSCTESLFTDENSPISPGIMGGLYESSLIAGERQKSGVFFTPKMEVDLMCRLALYELLCRELLAEKNGSLTKISARGLIELLSHSSDCSSHRELAFEFRSFFMDFLDRISIVDPACGSGDFLVGMSRVLVGLFRKLGVDIEISLLSKILNCLYGVDIQPNSLDIAQARLTLFLLSELPSQNARNRPDVQFPDIHLQKGNGLTQDFSEFFPEIMGKNGGFDLIIGNPPYIRQEKLYYQDKFNSQDEPLSAAQLKRSRDKYKKYLQSYVQSSFDLSLGKTCDIYVYFYFKALDLLKPGGTFAYLTSNTWLDSNFGEPLQEALLRFAHLKYLINNHKEKSFDDADINTVITVGAKKEKPHILEGRIGFVNLYVPYTEVYDCQLFRNIHYPDIDRFQKFPYTPAVIWYGEFQTHKHVKISEADLWEISGASLLSDADNPPIAHNGYELFKWSKFFRAPLIYYQIFPRIKSHFLPIGERFKRGYTTGANAFFYLPLPGLESSHRYFNSEMDPQSGDLLLTFKNPELKSQFERFSEKHQGFDFRIEHTYWMRPCAEGLVDEFSKVYRDPEANDPKYYIPNYLIKSSKELDHVFIHPRHLNLLVLHINSPKPALAPGVREYIKWGESMGFHERPTCSSRRRWYDLSVKIRKPIICIIDVHERYVFSFNPYRFDLDARLYGLDFGDSFSNKLHFLVLKSTLYPLLMELEGRLGLGDGALDLKLCDYENLPLPDRSILAQFDKAAIERLFAKMSQDNLQNQSIFGLLNAKEPDDIAIRGQNGLDNLIKAIDDLVFKDILHLDEGQRLAVYSALLQLVTNRIQKSRT